VRTQSGALLPLSELVTSERRRGWAAIHRYEGRRAITIVADVDNAVVTTLAANEAVRALVAELAPDPAVVIGYEGEFSETNRSFDSLKISFFVAIGAIFTILGAQFRSFLQPLIVLATVPFSFIGVAVGLFLVGDPFTIASGIALVGLAGMVVNDSLVLIDFVNKNREGGLPVVQALREAATDRMRAILLTTITTVFGVLPMAVGMGGRSAIWSPMATSIAFGLSFATVLTLLVIPSLYLILEDLLWLLGKGEAIDFEARAEARSLPDEPRL